MQKTPYKANLAKECGRFSRSNHNKSDDTLFVCKSKDCKARLVDLRMNRKTNTKVLPNSTTTPRPLHSNPKYNRHANNCHEIMYRMGHLRTKRLSTPEPRNSSRHSLHEQRFLLRCPHTHQQPSQRTQASR